MIVPDAKAYHSREPVVFKQSKIGRSALELAFLSTPKNLSSLEHRYSLGIVQICFQPPELAVSDLLNILTVTTFSALSTSTDATGVEVAILLFCEIKTIIKNLNLRSKNQFIKKKEDLRCLNMKENIYLFQM